MINYGNLELFLILLIGWSPIVLIADSDRTRGKEKIAWMLAVFLLLWLGWVFYLLFAPLKKRN